VVEANEFPDLSRYYGVSGVPKVIINDRLEFTGAIPEEAFVEAIRQALAADPEDPEAPGDS
jgi:predicted DsbA family dithiol-disulfide isomerase